MSHLPDFTEQTIDNGQIHILYRIRGSQNMYKAYSTSKTDPFAVKCMCYSPQSLDQVRLLSLYTELTRQAPSNVINLRRFICQDPYLFLILDYAEPIDVVRLVNDEEGIRETVEHMLDAVEAIHLLDIHHRDIKLENFMDVNERYVLGGFEQATKNDGVPPPNPFGYDFSNYKQYDLWCLGVTIFKLLTDCEIEDYFDFPDDLFGLSSGTHDMLQDLLFSRKAISDIKLHLSNLEVIYVEQAPDPFYFPNESKFNLDTWMSRRQWEDDLEQHAFCGWGDAINKEDGQDGHPYRPSVFQDVAPDAVLCSSATKST